MLSLLLTLGSMTKEALIDEHKQKFYHLNIWYCISTVSIVLLKATVNCKI